MPEVTQPTSKPSPNCLRGLLVEIPPEPTSHKVPCDIAVMILVNVTSVWSSGESWSPDGPRTLPHLRPEAGFSGGSGGGGSVLLTTENSQGLRCLQLSNLRGHRCLPVSHITWDSSQKVLVTKPGLLRKNADTGIKPPGVKWQLAPLNAYPAKWGCRSCRWAVGAPGLWLEPVLGNGGGRQRLSPPPSTAQPPPGSETSARRQNQNP